MTLTLRRRHLFPLDGCWNKACQRLVLAGTLVLTGCLSESSDSVTSTDDKSELLLPKNGSTQSTPHEISPRLMAPPEVSDVARHFEPVRKRAETQPITPVLHPAAESAVRSVPEPDGRTARYERA